MDSQTRDHRDGRRHLDGSLSHLLAVLAIPAAMVVGHRRGGGPPGHRRRPGDRPAAESVHAAADDPYYQPVRLSTVVHAPVGRVTDVLATSDRLLQLLGNGWLSPTAVDPTRDHAAFEYDGDPAWEPVQETARAAEEPHPDMTTPPSED